VHPSVNRVGNKLNVPKTSMSKITDRRLLLITSLTFFLMSFSLISLIGAPINGYELSIYQATPPIFWIAMIIGLINGALLYYRCYQRNDKLWIIGLFQVLVCNIMILSVSILRGFFYLQRMDSITYVGYSKDILIYGSIPEYNFYPLNTLLITIISDITNLSLIHSAILLPSFFLLIFILSVFIWSRSISREPIFVAAMSLSSFIIIFAWFVPSIYYETFCVLMLPLFLYFIHKAELQNIRYMIIAIILFALFTLSHILVAFGLLLFLIIFFLSEKYVNSERRTVTIPLLLICIAILLLWVLNQVSLTHSIIRVFNQIFGLSPNITTFTSFENIASRAGLWNTVQSVIACTIDDIIYIALALWAFFIIFRNNWRRNPVTKYFACLIGGMLFLLVLILTSYTHNPFRLINLNFVMIFTFPLIAFLVLYKLKQRRVNTVRFVILLILVSLVASTFSIYPDPIQFNPNLTITASETSGANWLINQKDQYTNTSVIQTSIQRFSDLIYGHIYTVDNIRSLLENETTNHFATIMSSNETVEDMYQIVSTFDEEAYNQVWKNSNRFVNEDFQALALSNMVNKNYENGGFSCYLRE